MTETAASEAAPQHRAAASSSDLVALLGPQVRDRDDPCAPRAVVRGAKRSTVDAVGNHARSTVARTPFGSSIVPRRREFATTCVAQR